MKVGSKRDPRTAQLAYIAAFGAISEALIYLTHHTPVFRSCGSLTSLILVLFSSFSRFLLRRRWDCVALRRSLALNCTVDLTCARRRCHSLSTKDVDAIG